jgi:hypothetical protein
MCTAYLSKKIFSIYLRKIWPADVCPAYTFEKICPAYLNYNMSIIYSQKNMPSRYMFTIYLRKNEPSIYELQYVQNIFAKTCVQQIYVQHIFANKHVQKIYVQHMLSINICLAYVEKKFSTYAQHILCPQHMPSIRPVAHCVGIRLFHRLSGSHTRSTK